jgi:hypothetical protein
MRGGDGSNDAPTDTCTFMSARRKGRTRRSAPTALHSSLSSAHHDNLFVDLLHPFDGSDHSFGLRLERFALDGSR